MKTLFKYWPSVGVFAVMIMSILLMQSCSKAELDIRSNFPFEVNVMPLPEEVANGQSVEIRMTIQPTGTYNHTQYFIRYFQYDGQGTLQYYNQEPYLPNDSYSLASTQFRLYYTSLSSVSQYFEVWIFDNFGNEKKLSFQFGNSD